MKNRVSPGATHHTRGKYHGSLRAPFLGTSRRRGEGQLQPFHSRGLGAGPGRRSCDPRCQSFLAAVLGSGLNEDHLLLQQDALDACRACERRAGEIEKKATFRSKTQEAS
jgi:hypothetical protein